MDLVNNQILYNHSTKKHEKLLRLYSESQISNSNDTETTYLPLMTNQSNRQLLAKKFSFHFDIIIIAIKGLHHPTLSSN